MYHKFFTVLCVAKTFRGSILEHRACEKKIETTGKEKITGTKKLLNYTLF